MSQAVSPLELGTAQRLACVLGAVVFALGAVSAGCMLTATAPDQYLRRALQAAEFPSARADFVQDREKILLRSSQAIALDSQNPDFHYFRGAALSRLAGQSELPGPDRADAVESFKASLARRPGFHYPWLNLATVLAADMHKAAGLSDAIEQAARTAPHEIRTAGALIQIGIENWQSLSASAQTAVLSAVETGMAYWPAVLVQHARAHGYKQSACVVTTLHMNLRDSGTKNTYCGT